MTAKKKACLGKVVYVRTDARKSGVYAKDVHQLWGIPGLNLSPEEGKDLEARIEETFFHDFNDFHKAFVRTVENVVELVFRYRAARPSEILLDEEAAPKMADNLGDILDCLSSFFDGGAVVSPTVEYVASKVPKKGGGRRPKQATSAKSEKTPKSTRVSKAVAKPASQKAATGKSVEESKAGTKATASAPTPAPKAERSPDNPSSNGVNGGRTATKVVVGKVVTPKEDQGVVTTFKKHGKAQTTGRIEMGSFVAARIQTVQNQADKVNEALQAAIQAGSSADVVSGYTNQLGRLNAITQELQVVLDATK